MSDVHLTKYVRVRDDLLAFWGGTIIGAVHGELAYRLGGNPVLAVLFAAGHGVLAVLICRRKLQLNIFASVAGGAAWFFMNWGMGRSELGLVIMGMLMGWLIGYLPPGVVGALIGFGVACSIGAVEAWKWPMELQWMLLLGCIILGWMWGRWLGQARDKWRPDVETVDGAAEVE